MNCNTKVKGMLNTTDWEEQCLYEKILRKYFYIHKHTRVEKKKYIYIHTHTHTIYHNKQYQNTL
jgi:metallophosphoesterase superfamily enzyme